MPHNYYKNSGLRYTLLLLLLLLTLPARADSVLSVLDQWLAGITTSNQDSNASFKGGVTADGGKTFATNFSADQKIDVLADIRVAPEHFGKTGSLYAVARYNNAWFMKINHFQWQAWDKQIDHLQSYAQSRPLQAIENIKVAEQLNGLAGEFEVYVGYKIDGDIHYNATPFSFTVKQQENKSPVADAGVDKDLQELTQVTLDGSLSHDPDGSMVTYLWQQISGGTAARLDDPTSAKLTFTAPDVTHTSDLKFKLTVTDNQGATASDEVMVTVRYVPEPVVVSVLLPNCIAPQVLENSVCVTPLPTCVAPQVLENGVCVTPAPTCTAPQVLENGVCVTPAPTCIAPQVLENGACVTPAPTCTAPQVLENGVCVTPVPTCIAPQVLENGICVTPAPTCTVPQVLENGVCVTPAPTCIAPQVLENGVCVTPAPTCTAPQVLENGVCVTPPPTCVAPQVLENGVCVTPVPEIVCTFPQIPENGVCITPTLIEFTDGKAETLTYKIDSSKLGVISREASSMTLYGFNVIEDKLVFQDVSNGTVNTANFVNNVLIRTNTTIPLTSITFDETVVSKGDIFIGQAGYSLILMGINPFSSINYSVENQ